MAVAIGALFGLLWQVRAEQLDDLAPWSYVSDFANALSHGTDNGTREQLTRLCVEADDRMQVQVAVVTIRSLSGAALAPFGNEMYKRWGIGYPPQNRGILVLMVTNDRKHWVEVGSGLTSILTPDKLAAFDRRTESLLQQGDYDRATLYLTGEVARTVGAASHVALASQPNIELPQSATGFNSPVTIAVVAVLGAIVLAFGVVFMAQRSSRRRGLAPRTSRLPVPQPAGSVPARISGAFGGGGGFSGFGGDVSSRSAAGNS